MSADDNVTGCPSAKQNDSVNDETERKKRTVSFPDDERIVTEYFEPANPWHDVPSTTRSQLASEYLEACRRHCTPPIDSVVQQIREIPENAIGGSVRAPRLLLTECDLLGPAPADALEAVLRKVQFRRLEIDHASIDDEGAEAIFDMVEYYESAVIVCISGPRLYGIRGWQAASRMIKKSAELSEMEISESPLEASHAPVLARALRPLTCRLRSLCLQRAALAGDPLLCLVIALKSNSSVRELRLGDNGLTPSDACQLSSLLRYNMRLQLLDLSNNLIQDAGVGHICDALTEQAAQSPPSAAASPLSPHTCPVSGYESRGLAFLVLWNNQLTWNCAHHLAKVLRVSHSLCVLNVGRNALGAEAVGTLCSVRGAGLVSLGLQAARLGPDAAAPLARLVAATPLQRLDLRDNKLGGAGLQTILAALKENTTLTQIDLDDPQECSGLGSRSTECATVSRLTRDIRAACSRNEPPAAPPPAPLLRKISLTCHTHTLMMGGNGDDERRVRLRSPAPSPAPSPAGSPVPHPHGPHGPHGSHSPHTPSRFSVTRVTPERESCSEGASPSPARPTSCPPPSRFKVVQVAEPPKIQIQPATVPPRTSRFSVTRNYDSIYNPTPPPSPALIRDTHKTDRPTHRFTVVKPDESTVKLDETGVRRADCNFEDKKVRSRFAVTPASIESKIGSYAVDTGAKRFEVQPASIDSKIVSIKDESELNRPNNKVDFTRPDNCSINTGAKIDVSSEITKIDSVLQDSVSKEKKEIKQSSEVNVCNKFQIVPVNMKPKVPKVAETAKPTEIELKPLGIDASTEVRIEQPAIQPVIEEFKKLDIKNRPTSEIESKNKEIILDSHKTKIETETDLKKSENLDKAEVKKLESITRPNVTGSEIVLYDPNALNSLLALSESIKSPEKAESVITTPKNSESHDSRDGGLTPEEKLKKIESDRLQEPTSELKDVCVKNKDSVSVNDSYKDKRDELTHSETISRMGDDAVLKTETKLFKNSVGVSENEIVDIEMEVKVRRELHVNVDTKVHQNVCIEEKRDEVAMKQIEAITEDLGNLIEEMQNLSTKTRGRVKSDSTQNNINSNNNISVPVNVRDVVLKKNKSESSLDSPDLEVSRLMRKQISAFCDSSSSLEISGSSVESLNAENQAKAVIQLVESDIKDRRDVLSTESSIESASDVTPVNRGNILNLSVSSNESVSPIIFGGKKIHGSLSSLEASVSSLESGRHEKIMVTSADSGIEYSLQNPSEAKEDASSNEGTLTHNSSLKEVKPELHDTLTSPKRTSSLLDVPALKTKGIDRMRKISWVAPSASFHIPKPEEKVEMKLPTNLEKLLSLFQHPSSLFSRNQNEEEKKSASNTPPRKDSSLTSSFWSWGSSTEKFEREDVDSLSEATDSTLSERVQHSFVDESFSKKLDSKTPSTDEENTLSEFQTINDEKDSNIIKVTDITTDNLVQTVVLSECASGRDPDAVRDVIDLIVPNDSKNVYDTDIVKFEEKEPVRPRSFAAVLKSGSENTQDKSPETGHSVDKIPSKIIRGIKENISPENTLTTSMTTALAIELSERKPVWEVPKEIEEKSELAPIATIEETCDEDDCIRLPYIDDLKIDEREEKVQLDTVDLGKDALSYLMYDKPERSELKSPQGSLAQELKEAEMKEQLQDLSPELIVDEAVEVPEVFSVEIKGLKSSPPIPERAKIKKSNSLEDLSNRQEKESPKTKTIAFKVPETSTTPRDIPVRRTKLRSRSGSSPKSLPESLNKPCPLTKMETLLNKKKKKVSSLGKMARDSLLALNMSEEEMAEFRRSYKLTSVESLKSLESVSENSQSGTSVDSRCRACLRTSQESLMSLDSISEDCRCLDDCEKRAAHSNR